MDSTAVLHVTDVPKPFLLNPTSELIEGKDVSIPPTQKGTRVRIPDLFASIMAPEVAINPHYHKVKTDFDVWHANHFRMSPEVAAALSTTDFVLLAAAYVPRANEYALRVVVDWCYWAFFFDDLFDDDPQGENMAITEVETNQMIAILNNPGSAQPDKSKYPLRYLWHSICERVKEKAPADSQKQWNDAHMRYFGGMLKQGHGQKAGLLFKQDEKDYIRARTESYCTWSIIAICAWAHNVRLPQHAYDNASVQECIRLSGELGLLANDIISYRKEAKIGFSHNFVSIVKNQGRTTQEAMDRADELYKECFQRWFFALASMPVWGEQIDRDVLSYVEASRTATCAALWWHFRSARYWDNAIQSAHDLYSTRILDLTGIE